MIHEQLPLHLVGKKLIRSTQQQTEVGFVKPETFLHFISKEQRYANARLKRLLKRKGRTSND